MLFFACLAVSGGIEGSNKTWGRFVGGAPQFAEGRRGGASVRAWSWIREIVSDVEERFGKSYVLGERRDLSEEERRGRKRVSGQHQVNESGSTAATAAALGRKAAGWYKASPGKRSQCQVVS